MKKLIFLLFFPIFVFSQNNERQQKEQVRNSGTYNPQSSSQQRPTYSPQNSEFLEKNSTKEQNRSHYTQNNQRQPVINYPYRNYGGLGWNRWNPRYGWNSYYSYHWYDNWGYRNPARVYIYNNGIRDTIKVDPVHGSFGLQYNLNNELGVWATFGKKFYFVIDFSKTNNKSVAVYYPYLTLDKVLPWSDRKLSDEVNSNMFSVGLGKKINKKMGLHMSLGIGGEERKFRFYDEMYVLSNNGQYTFPNYKKTITTIKIGGIIDFSRNFTTKFDYDLNRGCISYGLGLRF
jgi:hypothetical protein